MKTILNFFKSIYSRKHTSIYFNGKNFVCNKCHSFVFRYAEICPKCKRKISYIRGEK